MDGVLIDAKAWHYDALNLALSHFGYKISLESHLLTFDGLPTRQKLEIMSKTMNFPVGLHNTVNLLKQKYTIQISYKKCFPTFNHVYALSKLSKDFKLAVCSNSIRKTIETLMELSDLNQFIDLIFSNEDVKNPKPSPEMYLETFKALNLKPEECLILEDNENGIAAAKSSGAHLLRIADPNEVTYNNIKNKINEINKK